MEYNSWVSFWVHYGVTHQTHSYIRKNIGLWFNTLKKIPIKIHRLWGIKLLITDTTSIPLLYFDSRYYTFPQWLNEKLLLSGQSHTSYWFSIKNYQLCLPLHNQFQLNSNNLLWFIKLLKIHCILINWLINCTDTSN